MIAKFRAKAGKEDALKAVLLTLVAPTRREIDCHQYDLLQGDKNKGEFCFVERWGSERALEQHLNSDHVKKALADAADLIDGAAEGGRYAIV